MNEFNFEEIFNKIAVCMDAVCDAKGVERCLYINTLVQLIGGLKASIGQSESQNKERIKDLEESLRFYAEKELAEKYPEHSLPEQEHTDNAD